MEPTDAGNPRVVTTKVLRSLIDEGARFGFNRQAPPDLILDPQGRHLLFPRLRHEWVNKVHRPDLPHVRCEVWAKVLGSDEPQTFLMDVLESSFEALREYRDEYRHIRRPEPQWHDVLEMQTTLIKNLSEHPMSAVMLTEPAHAPQPWDATARSRVERLRLADPMWVTAEMLTLVESAASSMPAHALAPADLITDTGFAVFERSVLIEGPGGVWPIRAAFWYPAEGGLHLIGFVDRDDDAFPLESKQRQFDDIGWGRLVPHLSSTWSWSDDAGDVEEGEWRSALVAFRRLMASLWVISTQRIVVMSRQRPLRAIRRAAERANLPHTDIVVVTLRRPEHQDRDGEVREVEWSHRWLVSGHWRRWPSKDGTIRLVWVNPYIKGPADKPFIPKRRFYRLVR